MAPDQFNSLSMDDRFELVTKKGTFLFDVSYFGYRCLLFVLETGMLIEVTWDMHNGLINRVIIPNETQLAKFLDRMEKLLRQDEH